RRAEPELVLGAEHAGRDDAAHRLLAEHEPIGQLGAGPRPQDEAARVGHVGRAAHHLRRFAAAVVDVDERELGRVGMRPLAGDARDDDAGELRELLATLDLEAGQRQPLDDFVGVERAVDELPQPCERHPHRNCRAKRTSPSKKWVMLSTPYLSIAMRSMPQPKAKPVYFS